MAKAMLGKLPLSAWQGPRDTLEGHVAGDDGEWWLANLNRFNRKEFREMRDDFPIWMTITRSELPHLMRAYAGAYNAFKGIYPFVESMAFEMLGRACLSERTTGSDTDLALATPTQLGFSGLVQPQDFFQAAQERGLKLCDAGDAFDLRRQYLSQPRYEELVVATPPIQVAGYNGGLFCFGVGRQGKLVLRAVLTCRSKDLLIRPDQVFVFIQPRKDR